MDGSPVVVRVRIAAVAAAACAVLAVCTAHLGSALKGELPVPLTALAGDAADAPVAPLAGGR